jgi:hypothetical protein
MPSTIRRSPPKAQRTWIKAHDAAAKEYGDGERAHRTAYSALKHSFQRSGDRWIAKATKGPSDPRAKQTRTAARRGIGKTFGGIDYYGSTRGDLYERARKLHVEGRSGMTKRELAEAIQKRLKSRDAAARRH